PAWYGCRRCVDCGLIKAPTARAWASSAELRGTPPSSEPTAAGVLVAPGLGAAAAAAVVDVVEPSAPATTGAATLDALLLPPAVTSPSLFGFEHAAATMSSAHSTA